MVVRCQTIMNALEKMAPPYLAEEWDRIGLQIGSPAQPVNKLFLTLDLNMEVLEEALAAGTDMIIVHHTPFFNPLQEVRTDLPSGRLLTKIINNGLILYTAHTNMDAAENGINDVLARKLGLREIRPLCSTWKQKLYKIVVFVPGEYSSKVQEGMTLAGAGWIGNYSDCTFQVNGTGTFRPLNGTNPFIGSTGELAKVEEVRLETIATEEILPRVIHALKRVHPYEEVAYDIYPLINEGKQAGLGRVGFLQEAVSLAEFMQQVKDHLSITQLRYCGDNCRKVEKIAVCGGAGAALMPQAISAGAQVLVTADVKYHEAQNALAHNLAVIDAGHYATERLIIPVLREYLSREFLGEDVEIAFSQLNTDPFRFY